MDVLIFFPILKLWPFAIFFAFLGASLASFIAAMVDRYPLTLEKILKHSHCSRCHKRINPPYLMPIFGFFLALGRCRTCQAPIPKRLLMIDVSGALLGFLSWWLLLKGLDVAAHFFVASLLLLAIALLDLRCWIIPHSLTIPLWLMGLVSFEGSLGGWSRRLWLSLLILSLFLLATWGFTAIFRAVGRIGPNEQAMGMGDATLMAAISTNFHWYFLPFILVLASSQAILVFLWITRRENKQFSTAGILDDFKPPASALPFGTFLAIAAMEMALVAF